MSLPPTVLCVLMTTYCFFFGTGCSFLSRMRTTRQLTDGFLAVLDLIYGMLSIYAVMLAIVQVNVRDNRS
jgi:hypothetical protein